MKRRYPRLETEPFPRIESHLRPEALRSNYRAILEQVPSQSILPMVKANAYGHGAVWTSKQLVDLPALYGLGVATLEEGAELRSGLGPRARRTKILVFSGTVPWSDEKGAFCEENHLTAVIASDEDWFAFQRGGWPGRIRYELKFNSGMNRLGLNQGMGSQIAKVLRNQPSENHPDGICTHLAVGEDANHSLSRVQLDRFSSLRSELSGAFPAAHFHFANSSAIWGAKNWGVEEISDVVRPGISLYGIPPWDGAPVRGISPVMTLRASVIKVRKLKQGESLGYAATFRVRDESAHVALLGAGYADGIKRTLSSRGLAWMENGPTRFIGIVSMDISAVLCNPKTRVGEWVEILGPHVDPWAQAKEAGTIPYELFTAISPRVRRIYD